MRYVESLESLLCNSNGFLGGCFCWANDVECVTTGPNRIHVIIDIIDLKLFT